MILNEETRLQRLRRTGGSTTTDKRGLLATVGIGVLLVLCCAAPALLAAGTLGALGAWLGNPWVIGAAVLAALVVAWQVWTWHRRAHTCRDRPDRHDNRPSSP